MLSDPPDAGSCSDYFQSLGNLRPWVVEGLRDRSGSNALLLALLYHIGQIDRTWLEDTGRLEGVAGLYVGLVSCGSDARLSAQIIAYGTGLAWTHTLDEDYAEYLDFPRKSSWEQEENNMSVGWRRTDTEYTVEHVSYMSGGGVRQFVREAVSVHQFQLLLRVDYGTLEQEWRIYGGHLDDSIMGSSFCSRLHDALAVGVGGASPLMDFLLTHIRRNRIELYVMDACRRGTLRLEMERDRRYLTLNIALIGDTALPLPSMTTATPLFDQADPGQDYTAVTTLPNTIPGGSITPPNVVQSNTQQETKTPIVPPSAERRLLLNSRQRGDKDEPYSVDQGSDDPVYRRPSRRNRGTEPKR